MGDISDRQGLEYKVQVKTTGRTDGIVPRLHTLRTSHTVSQWSVADFTAYHPIATHHGFPCPPAWLVSICSGYSVELVRREGAGVEVGHGMRRLVACPTFVMPFLNDLVEREERTESSNHKTPIVQRGSVPPLVVIQCQTSACP